MYKCIVVVLLALSVLFYIFIAVFHKKGSNDIIVSDMVEGGKYDAGSIREFQSFDSVTQKQIDFILALPGVIKVDRVIMISTREERADLGIRVVKDPAFLWGGLEPKIRTLLENKDIR